MCLIKVCPANEMKAINYQYLHSSNRIKYSICIYILTYVCCFQYAHIGGIFSTADGWGKHGKLVHSGTVKIYAWKVLFALKTFQQTVTLPSIASTMDLKQNIDRDYDFIDVKVSNRLFSLTCKKK